MPDANPSGHAVRFGVFELDKKAGELRKRGLRVPLQGLPIQILALLLEHPGQLVTREELRSQLWPPDTFVDFDHSLHNAIARVRDALGDSATSPRFIETLPRRGYRFVGQVDDSGTHEAGLGVSPQIPRRRLPEDPDEGSPVADDVWSEGQRLAERIAEVGAPAPRSERRLRRVRLAWIAAAACLLLATAALLTVWIMSSRRAPADRSAFRFVVSPPALADFNPSHAFMALSPDGHSLAFVASSPERNRMLWVRSLDSLTAREISGSDGAAQPFWSPDSQYLAFITPDGKLKKIAVSGGVAQTLSDGPFGFAGTWNRDGVILLQHEHRLYRVPATGGSPSPVTSLEAGRDELVHNWPHFLPDGRHFLYLSSATLGDPRTVTLYVGSLDSRMHTPLLTTEDLSHVVYAPAGYVVFMRGNTLVAQPFDTDRLRVTGEPTVVADQVDYNPASHRGAFSVSQTGVLAYRPVSETQLTWFDRSGRPLESITPLGHYANPALSPDGQRVAVARTNHETGVLGIWVIELPRRTTSPFAFDRRRADMPLWSLDGRRIAFKRPGGFYQRSSGGAGPDELLLPTRRDYYFNPLGWSPDGRLLLYEAGPPPTYKIDLWMVPTLGDRTPAAFTQTEFNETQGQISPDGRWIAYVSDESGRHDVYVRPYPSGAGKWHVSPAGGIEPTWRGDGQELFYLAPDRTMMSIPINGSPTFEAGPATRLFETRMSSFVHPGYTRNQYVVSADGQRLLINQPPAGALSAPITVVVNWQAALAARQSR